MSTAPELNRLQRWYFGWAEKYCVRLPPEARGQARAIDRLLYSHHGAGARAAEVNEGVGLANSRERLRNQFGARATLSLSARDGGMPSLSTSRRSASSMCACPA